MPAPLKPRACLIEECGVTFTPKSEKQRCCTEKHGKLLWNRESRADGRQVHQPWNDRRRDNYHRRRARRKKAATGARVELSAIAARDKWTCQICRKAVDRTLIWPHPMSPSLDHVVPLSKGGAHDPANVQLAHLDCNTVKGNRGGGEQLALIG